MLAAIAGRQAPHLTSSNNNNSHSLSRCNLNSYQGEYEEIKLSARVN